MTVITIRGQLGSGAPQIGRKIADAFHIDYMDREIINRIAERSRRPRKEIIAKEILPVTLKERIATFIQHDFAGSSPLSRPAPEDDVPPLDNARYVKLLGSVIKHLARDGSVVICGRGSQFFLRDMSGILHILVMAPLELRIKRVMESFGISEQSARDKITRYDTNRREFIKKYFKADLENPIYYDMTINTAHMNYDSAAALIIRAISLKDKVEDVI
jgi:cytidylate kinase